MCTDGLW
jgi:hypothetical protein